MAKQQTDGSPATEPEPTDAPEQHYRVVWAGALGFLQGEVAPASAFGPFLDKALADGAIEPCDSDAFADEEPEPGVPGEEPSAD